HPELTPHRIGATSDSCGICFVTDAKGRPSLEVLDLVLEALRCIKHRGAVSADGKTADGSGVLLPLAPALLAAPRGGLAMVFLRDESARAVIERASKDEGIELAGWRE